MHSKASCCAIQISLLHRSHYSLGHIKMYKNLFYAGLLFFVCRLNASPPLMTFIRTIHSGV